MPVDKIWDITRRSVEHYATLMASNCDAEFSRMIYEAAERLWLQDAPGQQEVF